MHPALMTALAAEKRAEELRTRASRIQLAAVSVGRTRPGLAEATDAVAHAASRLRRRIAAAGQPTVAGCCA